jgi:copper/silver efflux system protein
MFARIIEWSIGNRFLVVLATVCLIVAGVYSLQQTPLDAIPDLSDVQVIIYTEYPGQAPQIIEDQVVYPLTTQMLAVPFAKVVRGYSFFGFSLVYVIFEDGTDMYWARSRVLEYLNYVSGRLPRGVTPVLGPDATGVGWAFIYALQSDRHDLSQLRSMQDWYLKYQLTSVPGVSEVASIGGFVRQYQITVDPNKLRSYDIPISQLRSAVQRSNNEVGGRVLEVAEKEFMIRGRGYIGSLEDLKSIAIGADRRGTPVRLGDIATVELGPEIRRGLAEWNGEGETVGGIVVVRSGANAYQVIRDVKARLAELKPGLPEGVQIKIAYDRTALIDRAVDTLRSKLLEESLVVALVCVLFLAHFRSALVAIIMLPVAVLLAFIVMHQQGINANIMSLGGIAIAIGAMVDAAIIMIENAHKHIERDAGRKPHWQIIRESATEVGPALFYSLAVITVSFIPVFTLQAQEGRLFKPLAFTKTYAMAAAALLSITLVPVMMGYFIRGRIPAEQKNPINRILIWFYGPVLGMALRFKWVVLMGAVVVLGITVIPYSRLGSEFMPPLWEGDLLYMPTTLPGLSVTKAREILQQTDKILREFPEVQSVFGKIGRADTATDPAPLSMVETTIALKPQDEWPAGMTVDRLTEEMNRAIEIPGVTNAWTMPVKNRIDMLSTGIKTPVGIKILGPDLRVLEKIGEQVESVMRNVPGTLSAYSERVMGGNYLDFDVDRDAISRYGLTVGDVQDVIQTAIGGMNITTTVEGLARYPVNLRYSRELRDNPSALSGVLVPTRSGQQIPLGSLVRFRYELGPPGIKTENSRPSAWVYVDIHGVDVGSFVENARRAVAEKVQLPPGYTLLWSGQYEYMVRARERLLYIVPLTVLIILLIIYINTQSVIKTAIVFLAVPFSLVGAIWLIYILHYNLSIAVWVGLIALAGLDAETGVVMLLYLDGAYSDFRNRGLLKTRHDLAGAIYEGAVKRLRPKVMTISVIVAGLLPILWSTGTGADVMKRIATPMVGGVVTSGLMELLIYPIIFYLWRSRGLQKGAPFTGFESLKETS